MYDAIVVGARCAGSPTAMLLARKGYRVLLLDRAAFPSDTISTHVIHQPGVLRLKRWGLLDRVIESNCPPIRKITFEIAGVEITGQPPAADEVLEAYCPRRTILDNILLNAAIAAGVEFRDRFSMKQLLTEEGVVVGIRGRSATGETIDEHARVVIGADGRHSTVAKLVRAPVYFEKPLFGCGYFSYWSGVQLDGVELRSSKDLGVGMFPTNDGLTCIYVSQPVESFVAFRSDVERNYRKAVHSADKLSDRMVNAECVERVRGTAELSNFFRKPYGSGWALVGDAGYIKDPVTGQGITDAFRDAGLLADALDDTWAGRKSGDDSLSAYETKRNQSALPLYEFTCELASFNPLRPLMVRLLRALQADQAEADRFLGVVAGTTSVESFFAPAHVRQILRSESPVASRPMPYEERGEE